MVKRRVGKKANAAHSTSFVVRQQLVFGRYGRSAPEPIRFRIAHVSERGATAVSEEVLAVRPFDTRREGHDQGDNRWRDSTARHWLNSSAAAGAVDFGPHPPPSADAIWIPEHWDEAAGDFAFDDEQGFLAYFTPEEREALAEVEIASRRDGGASAGFDQTHDRVFFPSNEEMEEWVGAACRGYGAKLSRAGLVDSPWSDVSWCGWWQRDAFANGYDVGCINDSRAVGWEPAASCYAGYRPMLVLRPDVPFVGSGTTKNPYRLVSEA